MARNHDPNIGRFNSIDPLAEKLPGWSPYNYTLNNPIIYFDPDGTTTYTDSSGNVIDVIDDNSTSVIKISDDGRGMYMGETIEWNSFCINGDLKQGVAGYVDFDSFEALQFILRSLQDLSIFRGDLNAFGLLYYMTHGGYGYDKGNIYDFKTKGGYLPNNQYRGSQLVPGLYLSARDAGNYLAGAVARFFGVPEEISLKATGAFNLAENKLRGMPFNFIINPGAPYYGELPISSIFQRHGWNFKYLKK